MIRDHLHAAFAVGCRRATLENVDLQKATAARIQYFLIGADLYMTTSEHHEGGHHHRAARRGAARSGPAGSRRAGGRWRASRPGSAPPRPATPAARCPRGASSAAPASAPPAGTWSTRRAATPGAPRSLRTRAAHSVHGTISLGILSARSGSRESTVRRSGRRTILRRLIGHRSMPLIYSSIDMPTSICSK